MQWTPAATTTALALASAHGHGWANYAVLHEDGSLDHDAIEAAQSAGEAGPISGLCPSLTHTTGSGRLSWQIADDGACRIVVMRPLTAISPLAVGLDGYVVVAAATIHPRARDGQFQRMHWDRPQWGRENEGGYRASGVEVGSWWVTIDSVPELFEERHSDALGSAVLAVLGDVAPTRTVERIREGETDWVSTDYVEIDEHTFWMRDRPISRRSNHAPAHPEPPGWFRFRAGATE